MSTELAHRLDKQPDLRIMIQSEKALDQLGAALPKYYSPTQFAVIVRTAINKNPRLLDCTGESFMIAVLTAAQMGIAPDGRNGHLIPYGKECQFQADYKGLVGLVRRNENVQDIYADLVCDNDHFTITKGLHRDLIHDIDIRKPRGGIIGAYAVIQYVGGVSGFEFMTKEEIDAIRKRSPSSGSGPWVTDYGEMAKKTVIRRLLKLADLSPDTQQRIDVDTSIDITPPGPQIEAPRIAGRQQEALPDRKTQPVNVHTQEQREPHQTAAETPQGDKPAEQQGTLTPDKPKDETPEQKPKRQMKLPKAAEAKKESAPAQDDTPAGKLAAMLAEAGYTTSEAVALALKEKWCEPCDLNTPLDKVKFNLGDALEAFIGDFVTVKSEIDKMRNEGK